MLYPFLHFSIHHWCCNTWWYSFYLIHCFRSPRRDIANFRLIDAIPVNLYLHQQPWVGQCLKSLSDIVIFREDRLAYGNYFTLNKLWWAWKDDPRVLFVRYEDILKNKADMARKVAKFLGKTLSDESVQKIVQQTSFEVVKKHINVILKYLHNMSFF